MKLRDRKEKKQRAIAHTRGQYSKRKEATLEAIEKIRRGKKKVSAANMNKEMESRGYLPNGKGGWRRMTSTEKERYGHSTI